MESREGKIRRLEAEARTLEKSSVELRRWMRELESWSGAFVDRLEEGRAFLGKGDGFLHALAESPSSLGAALEEFRRCALENGIETASGNFFGYVPGGGLPGAAVGDFVAALTNKYTGFYDAAPGAVEVENQMVRWLIRAMGFPGQSWGTLQSGGSLATLTALLVARETRSWRRWHRGVAYLTADLHHAVDKALKISGLGHLHRRLVAVDGHRRMRLDALERAIRADRKAGREPWMILATAGTTSTGAVDPLTEIAEIARRHRLWFHVDAAYGGFFRLTREGKKRVKGIESADSLVLDPHKGLFLPYGCGAVLVRDASRLRRAFAYQSVYLEDVLNKKKRSPADYSPELTRPFRALRLWLPLKVHGLAAFRAALDEKLLLARHAFDRLAAMPGIETGPPPQLSCVTFRWKGPDDLTARHLRRIVERGRVHLSSTRLNRRLFLRICVLSFRSHLAHVERALEEIAG